MAFTYKTTKEEEDAKKKVTQDEENLRNHQTYTPSTYEQSDEVKGMWNTISNWQTPTWDKANNAWWNKLTDTMNAIDNREKFSYDVNGDALYQQYKDQYINQGKMAMMDTMGQAAAMTGGYGNSYAQSVGQQAYQGYMQQLTDKIPELYSLALDKYNSEGQDLYNKLSAYGSLYGTEYGEHRDAVADSNNQLAHLTDLYGIKSDEEYSQWYNGEQMNMTANQQEYEKLADLLGVSVEQAKNIYDTAYQNQYAEYVTEYQEGRDKVADTQWNKEFLLAKLANGRSGSTGVIKGLFGGDEDDDTPAEAPPEFTGKSYDQAVKYIEENGGKVGSLQTQKAFIKEKLLSGGVTVGGVKFTKYADYLKAYCEWAVS